MTDGALPLAKRPVHLGRGAVAVTQPEFTGAPSWYDDYACRTEADGIEGRLVSMHTFTRDWDGWEMHPSGDEVVICVSGAMLLTQELTDGTSRRVAMTQGEFAINPAGVWHTADIEGTATAVFVTAGAGTQTRPR
jgi:mannose-6-phosphate isomerase-like protein (cupin superfamily)